MSDYSAPGPPRLTVITDEEFAQLLAAQDPNAESCISQSDAEFYNRNIAEARP